MKKHLSYAGLAMGVVFGLFFVAEAKSAQGVVQETWTKLKGGTVSELTENKRYARTSNKVRILDEFADADLGEEYGSRYSALLIPPKTGDYTFWIAADDTAELWLSTDEDPSNLRKVISLNRYSGERKWTRKDQKSSAVQLKKGHLYFIRALHKQGGGGNHFSVAWQGPGFKQKVIRAASLEIPPLDKRTMELGKKTYLAEQRTTKILKALETTSPDRTEALVGKLNKTERTNAAEALAKLGQATKKISSPENLAKIKPYAAAA
ncbi:MAG: hypothetical protein KAU94_08750, partial [Verrucomicrobia bacterium]|nr:hypothetical protein [Verrucomicrobiota bacterium]